MDRLMLLTIFTIGIVAISAAPSETLEKKETILSTVLTPDSKEKTLSRQGRSYYSQRYGAYPPVAYYPAGPYYGVRPLYDRLEYRSDYDRCSRCYDDRDRDDYDRGRDRDRPRDRDDRYDDDRRISHRPTYGNRYDRNKNYDSNDDDKRYNTERKGANTNGTDEETDQDKKNYDDKDNRPSGSRRGNNRDRNKVDDRDRYRPDYYDRFLRDPYRERPYYEDSYRERRPLYDRYPDRLDDGYAGRFDGYGYPGYRRPAYDDRYDRVGAYDDGYGGYGPNIGRGQHDSFRPWDETYRGQAGWDAGGRGYYFASGRPDATSAAAWSRPDYARPDASSGWQNVGYEGYRDPVNYRGSYGYQDGGYRQGLDASFGQGYGQGYSTGWQNIGERRPYRDQSGVNSLDSRDTYGQPPRDNRYGQKNRQQSNYGQAGQSNYGQAGQSNYGQAGQSDYGQAGQSHGQHGQTYNQQGQSYGHQGTYNQASYPASTFQSTGSSAYSSTTPQTSYLYQRDDEKVIPVDSTTKQPSS